MNIIIKDLKLIEYQKFLDIQTKLTNLENNFVLFATHYPIFTVGKNEDKFSWAKKVDRGGSITYFDEGTLMIYFIFDVYNPPLFFKNIRKILNSFFNQFDLEIYYNKENAGFYIENRKIASLGFSYKNNRSNHGVAININPNLNNFNKINPCNLKGIKATSFINEGIEITTKEANIKLTKIIREFYDKK